MKFFYLYITTILLFLWTCSTGVELSEPPGYIKVTVSPMNSDTTLTIVNTTYGIDPADDFRLEFAEGKAFQDSIFFILYSRPTTFNEEDIELNILSSNTDIYEQKTVFNSYLPDGRYTSLDFIIRPSDFRLDGFEIPLITESGQPLKIELPVNYTVNSNDTTHVALRINVVESIKRFKDTFLFDPMIEVEGVYVYD